MNDLITSLLVFGLHFRDLGEIDIRGKPAELIRKDTFTDVPTCFLQKISDLRHDFQGNLLLSDEERKGLTSIRMSSVFLARVRSLLSLRSK